MTEIEHRRPDYPEPDILLELEYEYETDGVVDKITETPETSPQTIVGFEYDNRKRLTREVRALQTTPIATTEYDLSYTYDQGGNRLTMEESANPFNKTRVRYYYDVHPPDPNPYDTFNNRLMKYETYSVAPGGMFGMMGPMGPGGGGAGEQETLLSTTYYDYYGHSGNVERAVTETVGSDEYSAVRLGYALNERVVSFALGETWTWSGDYENEPENYAIEWAREFRYDGARARYLNRELDPDDLMAEPDPEYTPLSDVWSDYDDGAIYGDFVFGGGSFDELASNEAGLAKVLDPLGSPVTTYYHTDMIGTTRFMTNASGNKIETAVFTAFGERVNGPARRFGYAGAYGYQTDAAGEMPFLHVGHRYYDPSIGRFLQRDPIGIRGGLNVYAYAANAPANQVDPRGLNNVASCQDECADNWFPASGGRCGGREALEDCLMSCLDLYWPPAPARQPPPKDFQPWPGPCPPTSPPRPSGPSPTSPSGPSSSGAWNGRAFFALVLVLLFTVFSSRPSLGLPGHPTEG
jgi:RHS repeat-associated protein